VAALSWRAAPGLRLYISAGRGFESPTLNELAYRADGSSGFNDTLKAQTSRQVEVGAKWRGLDNRMALDVALFDARTSDEIGVLTNAGGRSAFQNVGRTKRQGAEASLRWQLTPTLRTALALTRLEATYLDSFQTCTGVPCNDANPQNRRSVPAGNRIAGTNRGSGFAELAWQPREATELAAEVRAQGGTPVNDLNSDFAGRFATLALRARQRYSLGQGKALELFARVDNVTDRAYAGSVIVNEGNSRFFEAAPGRNWLLGVTARFEFQ
jgi:iron complex outermembrane receptor protein